jgi:hypothetical protein
LVASSFKTSAEYQLVTPEKPQIFIDIRFMLPTRIVRLRKAFQTETVVAINEAKKSSTA